MIRRMVPCILILVGAGAAGAAPSRVTTAVAVKGRVLLRVEVVAVDVTVKNGARDRVSATAEGCSERGVRLHAGGNEVELEIDEFTGCAGPLTLELPPGGDVELQSVSGDLAVAGSFGEVEIASVSGATRVEGAARVRVDSVSGAVHVKQATDVDVGTVDGPAVVESGGTAPRIVFESATGGLDWSGGCARDCRLDVQTISGRTRLHFDGRSDFELRFQTRSGALTDALKLVITKRTGNALGGTLIRGRHKGGAGGVEVESISGALELAPRK